MDKRRVHRTSVILLSLVMVMTMFANLVGAEGDTIETQGASPVKVHAVADSGAVSPGQTIRIDVLQNDYTTGGTGTEVLEVNMITAVAAHGRASVVDNQVEYVAHETYVGEVQFAYKVIARDSSGKEVGNAATTTVTITISAANNPPTASDIARTINMNESVTIDLLAACEDPDQDTLNISGITQPANGTATLNGGNVLYEPALNFTGNDRFTYTVSDGKATASATITIVVNQPPLPEYKPLRPVLERVTYFGQLETGEHAWEAHWGWLNDNDVEVEALVCKFTGTVIGEDNFPDKFAAGRQYDKFTTIFTSANLVWTLKGPDGSQRTATAGRTQVPTPTPTTGHLTVQKQLEGGGDDDARFKISIRPAEVAYKLAQQEEPIYISVNDPWEGELEPGTYQVTEDDMPEGYYFEEMTKDGLITIVAGEEYIINIVNRYEPVPEPETKGTLVISKQVTGSGYSRTARFQVTIEPYGELTPMGIQEAQTVYISVNEPWTGTLPPGTYLVREVETPSSRYTLVSISNEGIVEIKADTTSQVTVTNRYRAPDPTPEPDPEVPEEPTKPDEPTEPEEPAVPEEPTEPEEPVDPEEPVEPEEPTEPEQPTLPKTSSVDAALVLGSILTIGGLWLSRKKR